MIRRFLAAVVLGLACTAAQAQTSTTCATWLATNPNPAGIPPVSGPGVTQRANFLAAGGKLVAISSRYYAVSIPPGFHAAAVPVVVLNLHGTGGYPEAEWTDWNATMAAQGHAFIALAWGGGTPGAVSDTQIYSDLKQILSEVGAQCPISTARKYLMGFSVGSAMSFAVMIRDVADQKLLRGQVAISGAAIGPLATGISVMHATVEANRSNAAAVQGIKSWMYCGALDFDHTWSMCTEMPYGYDFVTTHGGTATLYQDPSGTHHSLPASPAGYAQMYAFLVAPDDQSITAGTAPSVWVGHASSLAATASSGLAVAWASSTPGTCTVSGTLVTGVSPGPCTVTADQAGNAAWNPAPQVTLNLAVTATPGALSLSPANLDFGGQSMGTTAPSRTVTLTNTGGGPLTVSSMAASGAGFAVSHACATITVGASCAATVTFTPPSVAVALNATSAANGTLSVATVEAGTGSVPLAGTGERSLVTHYYRAILRRASDAPGKAFWESEATRLAATVDLNEAWYSMAASFFASAEYVAFARDNAGFVTDLYTTFFNRAPDAAGLAFWNGQLDAGMPRDVVLAAFMFSTEFTTFTQSIFGSTTVRREIDLVTDFYRGILGRLPDDAGLAFWIAQFRTAQCAGASAVTTQAESISRAFALSGEYAGRARSDAQYVGDLYNAFLRRGGDLAGVQFWVGSLGSHALTREQERGQFVASSEFQARVAQVIAQGCLP